jgi:uncharacterized protein YeaO (DUF488 family)
MIYTASFFQPENHHGKLVPISRTVPKGFSTKDSLSFFIPSSSLLKDWKAGKLTKEEYIDRYREEMKVNLPQIKEWVNSLDSEIDQTLLCWEKTTDKNYFCHRELVIKFVQVWKPICFGGCDIYNSKVLATV